MSVIVCSPSVSVKVCVYVSVYTLNAVTATGSYHNCLTFYSGHLFDIMLLCLLLKSLMTTRSHEDSQFRFGFFVDADLHCRFKRYRYL